MFLLGIETKKHACIHYFLENDGLLEPAVVKSPNFPYILKKSKKVPFKAWPLKKNFVIEKI